MPDIQNIISDLKKKYEQDYGFAVFDLDLKEDGDSISVRGEVLTEKQKEEVLSEIGKVSRKKVEDKIRVLSDPSSEGIGWASVRTDIADQKSRFVSSGVMNEKILKRVRTSQAKKGEVLRLLLQKEDQVLAQSGDLALGWVNLADVDLEKESLRGEWRRGILPQSGESVPVNFSEEDFIKRAEKSFGVKYILGANSEAAIDCSGFTQSVYKDVFDIILPRHSWDQKKLGLVVDLSEAQTGDLVFMLNKNTNTKHVGIWEKSGDGGNIIHASSADEKVVRQKADEVFAKYKLVEVRRIIKK